MNIFCGYRMLSWKLSSAHRFYLSAFYLPLLLSCHSSDGSWLVSNFVLFDFGFLQCIIMYPSVSLFLLIMVGIHSAFRIWNYLTIQESFSCSPILFHSSTCGLPNKCILVFTVSSIFTLCIFHLVLPICLFFPDKFYSSLSFLQLCLVLLNPSVEFFIFSVVEFVSFFIFSSSLMKFPSLAVFDPSFVI